MPSRRCRRCRRPDRACHRPSTRCSGIQWPRRTVRRCRCRRCWCPRCTPSAPQVWLAVAWSQVPWCKPSSGTAAPAWPFGRHAVVARSQYVPCAQSSSTQHPSPGTQVPCPSFCALQYPESHVPPSPDVDAPPVPVEGRSDELTQLTQLHADIWGGCGFPVGRDRRVAHREHLQGVAKNHARSTRSRNNAPG